MGLCFYSVRFKKPSSAWIMQATRENFLICVERQGRVLPLLWVNAYSWQIFSVAPLVERGVWKDGSCLPYPRYDLLSLSQVWDFAKEHYALTGWWAGMPSIEDEQFSMSWVYFRSMEPEVRCVARNEVGRSSSERDNAGSTYMPLDKLLYGKTHTVPNGVWA